MRTKVSEPTNGSVMILKARPANGSSSELLAHRSARRCPILMPLIGGMSSRRRQIIDHRVEQRLDALVLEGRAAQHRHEGEGDRALADAALAASRHRAPCRRDRPRAPRRPARPRVSTSCGALLGGLLVHVGRECRSRRTSAPSVSSCQMIAFICDEVDDADELALDADRQLHHQRHARRGGR